MAAGIINFALDNYDDLQKDLNEIEKKSQKVINRTFGDIKRRVPSWVSQEVREVYNIKAKDFKDPGIVRIRIYGDKLNEFLIKYTGRTLSARHFGKGLDKLPPESSTFIPVYYKELGGYRMTRLREPVPKSITIRKGHREKLTGKYGTPIFVNKTVKTNGQYLPFQTKVDAKGVHTMKSVSTVSVPQMITNKKVSWNIRKRMNVEIKKRWKHNIERIMK